MAGFKWKKEASKLYTFGLGKKKNPIISIVYRKNKCTLENTKIPLPKVHGDYLIVVGFWRILFLPEVWHV